MNESILSVTMDANVKKGFDEFCEGIGTSAAELVKMFALIVVQNRRVPFTVKEANAANTSLYSLELEETQLHTVNENNESYEKLVNSLAGVISPLPENEDYRELIAQWRLEDYENLT